MAMIRILITDDHQLVIDGIRLMIAEAPDMVCMGTANDGYEALAQLAEKEVDVLLLDVNMEGLNGLETCRAVHTRYPGVKVVALSMLRDGYARTTRKPLTRWWRRPARLLMM